MLTRQATNQNQGLGLALDGTLTSIRGLACWRHMCVGGRGEGGSPCLVQGPPGKPVSRCLAGGAREREKVPANPEALLLMASSQRDMEDWVQAIRRVIWAPLGGGTARNSHAHPVEPLSPGNHSPADPAAQARSLLLGTCFLGTSPCATGWPSRSPAAHLSTAALGMPWQESCGFWAQRPKASQKGDRLMAGAYVCFCLLCQPLLQPHSGPCLTPPSPQNSLPVPGLSVANTEDSLPPVMWNRFPLSV